MTATSDEQAYETERKRRRRRRYLTGSGFLLIALILVILIVLIAARECESPPPIKETVEVTRIVERTVVHTVEVPGPTQLVTQLVTTTPCIQCPPAPEPPPTGLSLARSYQILLIVLVGMALLFIAYRLRGTTAE